MAIPISNLDFPQVIRGAYDEANRALRVETIAGGGLVTQPWDSVTVAYPTATQEVYTFTNGGSPVNTVTLNYTDSTKNFLSSAQRT